MFYRKMTEVIEKYLQSGSKKVLVVDGLDGVGKTTLIRHVGEKLFKQVVEIDLRKDSETQKAFAGIGYKKTFFNALEQYVPADTGDNTLVFLDEFHVYTKLVSSLKTMANDERYTYVVAGTGLKEALEKADDRIQEKVSLLTIRPMDFTEFLLAVGVGRDEMNTMQEQFMNNESLDEKTHEKMLQLFKDYVIVGGMPASINSWLKTKDYTPVRQTQNVIREFYSRYMEKNGIHVPVVTDLEFPLTANEQEEEKLFFNDVGLMTSIVEFTDFHDSLYEEPAFETVVVTEALSLSLPLYVYKETNTLVCNDNTSQSAVAFVIDCEVKHISDELDTLKANDKVKHIYVLSEHREMYTEDNVTYIPLYDVTFLMKKLINN